MFFKPEKSQQNETTDSKALGDAFASFSAFLNAKPIKSSTTDFAPVLSFSTEPHDDTKLLVEAILATGRKHLNFYGPSDKVQRAQKLALELGGDNISEQVTADDHLSVSYK